MRRSLPLRVGYMVRSSIGARHGSSRGGTYESWGMFEVMDEDIDGSSNGRFVDFRFELLYYFGCNNGVLAPSEGVLIGDLSPHDVAGHGGAI